ncbi:hypothetical protein BABINDRAFT_151014 [Babjeviella inositovora NRRL Y-12698]|uniref:HTH APSES-type domain-containing protein n=1 Tax=Babjeviella inositovora NRRL Y-12698 TaxID=984486 RepID=A0A1E3QNM3_9ASCO|nr:uncharacterized protein BABINDRAFT_151014 [Babjeviella inositovora NRRL Y-12698]ODQ79293.1 hypothetical protein BABINDRAFT_151014 [Babjeviella inositovora NRRL Y-12698]
MEFYHPDLFSDRDPSKPRQWPQNGTHRHQSPKSPPQPISSTSLPSVHLRPSHVHPAHLVSTLHYQPSLHGVTQPFPVHSGGNPPEYGHRNLNLAMNPVPSYEHQRMLPPLSKSPAQHYLPPLNLASPNIPQHKSKSVDLSGYGKRNLPPSTHTRLPSIDSLTFSSTPALLPGSPFYQTPRSMHSSASCWNDSPMLKDGVSPLHHTPSSAPVDILRHSVASYERDGKQERWAMKHKKSRRYSSSPPLPSTSPNAAALLPKILKLTKSARKTKTVKKKTSSGSVGAVVDSSVPINFPGHPTPSPIEVPPYQRPWLPVCNGAVSNTIVQKAYSAPVLTSIVEHRAAEVEPEVQRTEEPAAPPVKPPRKIITVFEYQINSHWVMWDHETGLVHLTGIWKAVRELNEFSETELLAKYKQQPSLFQNGAVPVAPGTPTPANNKADIARLIESAPSMEVASQIKRIRGGFLKIQGTWLPFELARELALRICYHIRYCLVPIFGDQFPRECLKPEDEGFGKLVFGGTGDAKRLGLVNSGSSISANGDTDSLSPIDSASLSSQTSLALSERNFTPAKSLLAFRFPILDADTSARPEIHRSGERQRSFRLKTRSITETTFPFPPCEGATPSDDDQGFTSSDFFSDDDEEEIDQNIIDASKSLQLLSRGSSFSSVSGSGTKSASGGLLGTIPEMSMTPGYQRRKEPSPSDVMSMEMMNIDQLGEEGMVASSLLALSSSGA